MSVNLRPGLMPGVTVYRNEYPSTPNAKENETRMEVRDGLVLTRTSEKRADGDVVQAYQVEVAGSDGAWTQYHFMPLEGMEGRNLIPFDPPAEWNVPAGFGLLDFAHQTAFASDGSGKVTEMRLLALTANDGGLPNGVVTNRDLYRHPTADTFEVQFGGEGGKTIQYKMKRDGDAVETTYGFGEGVQTSRTVNGHLVSSFLDHDGDGLLGGHQVGGESNPRKDSYLRAVEFDRAGRPTLLHGYAGKVGQPVALDAAELGATLTVIQRIDYLPLS